MNRRSFFTWVSGIIASVSVLVKGTKAEQIERSIEYRFGKDAQLEWRHVWSIKRPRKIQRAKAEIAKIKELDAKLRALDELSPPLTTCEICDEIGRVVQDAELKGARVRFHINQDPLK